MGTGTIELLATDGIAVLIDTVFLFHAGGAAKSSLVTTPIVFRFGWYENVTVYATNCAAIERAAVNATVKKWRM